MGRLQRVRVRVGVVDSGINPRHPQAGPVAGGVGIHVRDGEVATDDDWHDLLGHGTAVAATIRGETVGVNVDVELYAIRVFRRRLSAHVDALLKSIEWAAEHDLDVLNSSLGCANLERRADFERVHRPASMLIVTAASLDGAPSLPAVLPRVIRVAADPELVEGELRCRDGIVYASPWARALGPLPKERNLQGTSLAVAHVTGKVAALLASQGVTKAEIPGALADMG